MGFPIGTPQNSEAVNLQWDLIREEYDELSEADIGSENDLKELADLVFVCYQYAALMGYDLDEAMRRVYISNMSKLDDNGLPIRRGDGKVLKGPNYIPPDLSDLV
jgi:predicted HAD superfamily Cof-like phosphohydrolase